MYYTRCTESQTYINISLSVSDEGWELISCSRAVKIIDECVFNLQKGKGEGGWKGRGRGGGGGEGWDGKERERKREREGVVLGEGGGEVGKVLISAL